jgi:hypothetical protein
LSLAKGHRVLETRGLDEFDVGLVQDHQRVARNLFQEGDQILLEEPGAGGIVGVGQEDDLGAGREVRGQGLEIVVEALLHGRLDQPAPVGVRGELVGDEALRARQHLLALQDEGANQQLDELVRAVADQDLLDREIEAAGESLLQIEGAAIGVEVHALAGCPRRGHPERRWSKRVLVGGQLGDVADPVLPLHLLDGLARHVGLQRRDVRRDERHPAHSSVENTPMARNFW